MFKIEKTHFQNQMPLTPRKLTRRVAYKFLERKMLRTIIFVRHHFFLIRIILKRFRTNRTTFQFEIFGNSSFSKFSIFFRLHHSDLEVTRSPATEFSGLWGSAGTKIHTLTTFWPKDIKIQRRDLEKIENNLPPAHFFSDSQTSANLPPGWK